MSARPLVNRAWLLELLRKEQYDEAQSSTPRGVPLDEIDARIEAAYRRGFNDRARSLILTLSQGDVEAGLAEIAACDLGCCDCVAEAAGV